MGNSGLTDQKEFGAEDLKFCNSKESCLLLSVVVVVVVVLLYFDLFSGDRQVGELSVVNYSSGSSLKIVIVRHKLLTIT